MITSKKTPPSEGIKNSPCVGICSTVYGDEVCKGCKRHFDEIITWNQWGDDKKQQVYTRLETLMQEAMAPLLSIVQPEALEAELVLQGIPYLHFKSAYLWLFLLWVKKPESLTSWEHIGIRLHDQYKSMKPTDLLNQIDDTVNAQAQILYDTSETIC